MFKICVKIIKIVPVYTSFALKSLNFTQILDNFAQSCDVKTDTLKVSFSQT